MDAVDFLLRQAHLPGNRNGKAGGPDLVTRGIGISHLYRGHHNLDGRTGSLLEAFEALLESFFNLLSLGDVFIYAAVALEISCFVQYGQTIGKETDFFAALPDIPILQILDDRFIGHDF